MNRTLRVLAIGVLSLTGCSAHFTDDDIAACKKDIKEQFSKQDGVTVTEVTLIRESPTKLMGFVKIKTNLFNHDIEMSKPCTATMGDDRRYIWQCG